jgi:PST family polysaccharide transporter
VFALSIGTAVLLAAGTFFAAPLLADVLQSSKAEEVLQVLALLLPLAALTVVPMGVLRREMRFKSLSRRTLAATIAGGVVAVAMALAGLGVWSLVGQHLVRAVVGAVWLLSVVAWRPRLHVSIRHLREVIPTSLSLLGTSLVSFGYTRMDKAIVGGALGAVLLGHYAVGTRVVQLLKDAVVTPLNSVSVSSFAAVQDDPKRLLSAYYGLTRFATLVGFPMCAGVGLTAHLGIPLVFGSKWMPAVPVVQVLCITSALHVLFIGTHPLAVAKGKTHLILWLNMFHAAMCIAGAWIGAEWGITGVAIGVVCGWLLMSSVGCAVMCRILGVEITSIARSAWLSAFATAIMAIAVLGVLHFVDDWGFGALGQLAVVAPVGAAVYAAVVGLLTPDPLEELVSQIRLLRSSSGKVAADVA